MTSTDLPDELTAAENELRLIYAEYRELKQEAERKRNAEKAALNKNRGADVHAENAAEVAKKLKNSGILEKLRADEAPKTQYKRASNLERRLHSKPESSNLASFSTTGNFSQNSKNNSKNNSNFDSKNNSNLNSNSNFQSFSHSQTPSRIDLNDLNDSSPQQTKPKNMFAAFLGATKPAESGSTALSASDTSPRQEARTYSTPSYSHNAEDRRTSPNFGYMPNGNRQKMVFVEAEKVDENFIRPIFEKFGHLLRITSLPEKKQAFVLFKMWDQSQNAIRELNGKTIEGVFFHVSVGDSRNEPKSRVEQKPWAYESKSVTTTSVPKAIQETRELVEYEEGEL